MADKILVLKNTKQGLVVDTVYNSNDTLLLKINNETTITLPDKPIEVKVPDKGGAEVFGLYAGIIGGIIAAIVALITLWKLVKKDKERASEINSLSTIAAQLTHMQEEAEKRHKSSKKPHITIKISTNIENKKVSLDFLNSNTNTTITSYKLHSDFSEFNALTSVINDSEGKQSFWISLSYKNEPFDFAILKIDYLTEEGFEFIQDLVVMFQNGKYGLQPSAIIDKQNSPLSDE